MAADLIARERLQPDSQEELDLAALCSQLWKDSLSVNEKLFKLQSEELAYSLKLRHYKYDTGNTYDRNRVQPHGPELFDLIRHGWSEICSVHTYIECRPQQPGADSPEMVEDAKIVLESILHDPLKQYARLRRRWVMGALAARSWVMAIDVIPNVGPYGSEIGFRLVPPWRFHRAPGWQDIHDFTCPWVCEEATMRLTDVRRRKGWKNLDKVVSDRKALDGGEGGSAAQDHEKSELQQSETDVVTVLKFWFRDDGATYEQPRPERRQLSPYQQFGECPMCQHQDAEVPRDEIGQVLSAEQMPMCPECGAAPLLPVRELEDVDIFKRFPNGRLVIVAPNCKQVLYDDAWPQKMRSFPYMEMRAYDHPIDPAGPGETTIHWTSQMVLNNLRRFSWEQMRRNVDLLIAPFDGLVNSKKEPWTFNDLHGQVAFYTNPQAIDGLKHFQGPGIPSGLPTVYNIFAEQFRMGRGTDQIGLTSSQSKDIPVGTVNALLAQGAVPTRDKLAALQEEESVGFGILLDIAVQIWGDERAVRYLGKDGRWRMKMLRAAALHSMDVVVTASPTLSMVKAEELDAFSRWANMLPFQRATAAKLANIPMSFVRDLEEREKQAGFMPGMPSPMPGGKVAPPPGPPPIAAGGGVLTGA